MQKYLYILQDVDNETLVSNTISILDDGRIA